jgi:RNA polymerase sigma-70 factor (ECF subfamily)
MTVTDQFRAREVGAAPDPAPAFEASFRAHWPRVYGVLVRLTGDHAEAEDLALETFWRLYQNPPRENVNLVGWLCRVALNLGYNALRAAKRRLNYEAAAGRDALEREADPGPEATVEQQQAAERVRTVLSEMPARDAQLLLLRHTGYSYKEIAAALNVAPASVGTLLARAEAEFAKRFGRME